MGKDEKTMFFRTSYSLIRKKDIGFQPVYLIIIGQFHFF